MTSRRTKRMKRHQRALIAAGEFNEWNGKSNQVYVH